MILSNLGILFRITWTFKKSFAAENSSFDVKKKNEQNTPESWILKNKKFETWKLWTWIEYLNLITWN